MRMTLTGGRRALARLPFLLIGRRSACGMIGQGAIIPAKAWLAQILLERAFAQSLASHQPARPGPGPTLRRSRGSACRGSASRRSCCRAARARRWRSGRPCFPAAAGSASAAPRSSPPIATPISRFLKDLRPGDLIEVQEIGGRIMRYRAGAGRVVRYDALRRRPPRPAPSIAMVDLLADRRHRPRAVALCGGGAGGVSHDQSRHSSES